MNKIFACLPVFILILLGGCTGDTSGETRQVSTPNPGFKSQTPPAIANNPKIPDATKKSLAHVIPPGGNASQPVGG